MLRIFIIVTLISAGILGAYLLGLIIRAVIVSDISEKLITFSFIKNNIAIIISIFTLICALITVSIGYNQIRVALKQIDTQSEIETTQLISNKVNLLKWLHLELQHNYSMYEKLKKDKESFINGESTHYFEFKTEALDKNISLNTFEYNPQLYNKIGQLYEIFNMGNRTFKILRQPKIEKEHRTNHYSQFFDNVEANEDKWKNLMNELLLTINTYEPIFRKLSRVANKTGTSLDVGINSKENKVVIFNSGGEAAYDVSLKIEIPGDREDQYVQRIPFLDKQTAVYFDLHKPQKPSNLKGTLLLMYKSTHSGGFRKTSYKILWDSEKWFIEDKSDGIIKTSIGHILDDGIEPPKEKADVTYEISNNGQSLVISNNGNSTSYNINVVKEYGDFPKWTDIKFYGELKPNETLKYELPQPDEDNISIGGKIIFNSLGNDTIFYKILVLNWKGGTWTAGVSAN